MNRACLIQPAEDLTALPALCEQARSHRFTPHILCDDPNRQAVIRWSAQCERPPPILDASADLTALLSGHEEIFFLPGSDQITFSILADLPPLTHPFTIQPVFAPPPSDIYQYMETIPQWIGWRAGRDLALRILRGPAALSPAGPRFFDAIQQWHDPPRWQSIPLRVKVHQENRSSSPRALTMLSSVLAVISFYRCEEWLHGCLTSMTQQTRPPENIVVIDDCSPALPLKLLEPFPNVTLLSTTRNVGPEKILNNIIHSTDYDAYMVQDADDWSAHDRLELSLRTGEQTGAELIGTHEFRLNSERNTIELCVFPENVNEALSQAPGHHLLHCTSLIGRALAMRIGGLNSSLRLAADTDFLHRAWHEGSIVNLPAFCYFRRSRPGSLTTDPATGHHSAARSLEHRFIMIRSKRNLQRIRVGQAPITAAPQTERVDFNYHQGPAMRWQKDIRLLTP